MKRALVITSLLVAAAGCGGPAATADAATSDAGTEDAGIADVGTDAHGPVDAAAPDTGLDAGGALDAGTDAGPVGDGFPVGAISFFRTACPSGWAAYAPATGRVVAGADATGAGATSGTPLASGEDRAHTHAATVSITTGSVSYAGTVGGGNLGVAAAGVASAPTTLAGSAGLPYVQLAVCEKLDAPSSVPVPHGTIAWFSTTTCPTAWSSVPALDGRWPIGVPAGAAPETTFGGVPGAAPATHSHDASGTVALAAHGIALAGGCCASGYAAAGDAPVTAVVTASDTALPFVSLRACTPD